MPKVRIGAHAVTHAQPDPKGKPGDTVNITYEPGETYDVDDATFAALTAKNPMPTAEDAADPEYAKALLSQAGKPVHDVTAV